MHSEILVVHVQERALQSARLPQSSRFTTSYLRCQMPLLPHLSTVTNASGYFPGGPVARTNGTSSPSLLLPLYFPYSFSSPETQHQLRSSPSPPLEEAPAELGFDGIQTSTEPLGFSVPYPSSLGVCGRADAGVLLPSRRQVVLFPGVRYPSRALPASAWLKGVGGKDRNPARPRCARSSPGVSLADLQRLSLAFRTGLCCSGPGAHWLSSRT